MKVTLLVLTVVTHLNYTKMKLRNTLYILFAVVSMSSCMPKMTYFKESQTIRPNKKNTSIQALVLIERATQDTIVRHHLTDLNTKGHYSCKVEEIADQYKDGAYDLIVIAKKSSSKHPMAYIMPLEEIENESVTMYPWFFNENEQEEIWTSL